MGTIPKKFYYRLVFTRLIKAFGSPGPITIHVKMIFDFVDKSPGKHRVFQVKSVLPGSASKHDAFMLADQELAYRAQVQERASNDNGGILHHMEQACAIRGSKHQGFALYETAWIF